MEDTTVLTGLHLFLRKEDEREIYYQTTILGWKKHFLEMSVES
jgi:hypothetical protein